MPKPIKALWKYDRLSATALSVLDVCKAQLLAFKSELIPNSTTSTELGWYRRVKGKGAGEEGRELHVGLQNQQTAVWCGGRTTQMEEMSLIAGWEFTTENYSCPQNDRILEIQETYWVVRLRKSPDHSWPCLGTACSRGHYGALVSGMYSLGTASPHQNGPWAVKLALPVGYSHCRFRQVSNLLLFCVFPIWTVT